MGHYAAEMEGPEPRNSGRASPPTPPMPTQAHLVFREALARHYKTERDRSEDCLGCIVTILQDRTKQPQEIVDQILIRLVDHYQRS